MKKLFYFIACIFSCQVNAQVITTIAGNGTNGFSGDGGLASAALLNKVSSGAFDKIGNLYIADRLNNRIRKIDTAGVITTIAGTGVGAYGGDGGLAIAAKLYYPQGIAFDTAGNLFIADCWNHRIRKVNAAGIITTVAGGVISGSYGEGVSATSALLSYPSDVTFDKFNNLYIADYANYRIRKVDNSGIIRTVAGTGTAGYLGDSGLAINAELGGAVGVKVDSGGVIYIADSDNNVIRKVDTSGVITTIVGIGTSGYSGDNGSAVLAELNRPTGIAIDLFGNMFIADEFNNVVREVDSGGMITTVAGDGTSGYMGDNGPAVFAELHYPVSVWFDDHNNLFMADVFNHCVRKIASSVSVNLDEAYLEIGNHTIYPNPSRGAFIFKSDNKDPKTLQLFNSNGALVLKMVVVETTTIDISNLRKGIYYLSIEDDKKNLSHEIVVVN